jgi:hypothetical protein
MPNSCARDARCYRPHDVEHWIQEVREAVQAVNAAVLRLQAATNGLNKSRMKS